MVVVERTVLSFRGVRVGAVALNTFGYRIVVYHACTADVVVRGTNVVTVCAMTQ